MNLRPFAVLAALLALSFHQWSTLLHGNFASKDVTKAISFPFTMTGVMKDARGNTRWGIEAQT